MSDTTLTETPTPETSAAAPEAVTTPATAPSTEENAALRNALAKIQADYAGLQGQLSSVIVERDGFKATADKFEPLSKEVETLRVQNQGFVNQSRESAIVETLRGSTHKVTAEPAAIKGILATFHESKKINRYAEDAAAEAVKAYKLIETEAPSLLRPATSGGGSPSARPVTSGTAWSGPFKRG